MEHVSIWGTPFPAILNQKNSTGWAGGAKNSQNWIFLKVQIKRLLAVFFLLGLVSHPQNYGFNVRKLGHAKCTWFSLETSMTPKKSMTLDFVNLTLKVVQR